MRELPPPPVIEPPKSDQTETDDARQHDTLPDGLLAPPEKPPEAAIELDALQIRAPKRWSFLRRRVRIPPRWQQWLADPQRRNPVGVGLSIAIHVAMIVLLALVLRWPVRTPAAEPILARVVQPVTGDVATAKQTSAVQVHEPVVRQVTAGSLETVALEPPPDLGSEISNTKSQIPDAARREQEVKVDPPVNMTEESVLQQTGSEARPTVPPKVVAPAEDRVPGMAGGSRVPPDLLQAVDALMQEKFKRRTPGGRSEGGATAAARPKARRRSSVHSTGSRPTSAPTAVGASTI